MAIEISASRLKKQIENKAYAYGTPPAVGALIGEYVIELLRDASKKSPHPLTFPSYGNTKENQLA